MSERGRDLYSVKPTTGFNETIPPEFLRPFPLPPHHPAFQSGRIGRLPGPVLPGPMHPAISSFHLHQAQKSLGLIGLLPPLIPILDGGQPNDTRPNPHARLADTRPNSHGAHPGFDLQEDLQSYHHETRNPTRNTNQNSSSLDISSNQNRISRLKIFSPEEINHLNHLQRAPSTQHQNNYQLKEQLNLQERLLQHERLLHNERLNESERLQHSERLKQLQQLHSSDRHQKEQLQKERLQKKRLHEERLQKEQLQKEHLQQSERLQPSEESEGEGSMSSEEREYHRILDKKRGIKRKSELISNDAATQARVTSPTVNLRRLNLSIPDQNSNQSINYTSSYQQPREDQSNDVPLNLTSPRLKVRVDVKKTPTDSPHLKNLSLRERKPNKSRSKEKGSYKKSSRKEDRRTQLLVEGRRQRLVQQQQQNQNNQAVTPVDTTDPDDPELRDNQDDVNNPTDDHNKATSTIDCPVCKDVAIAHFHYGGMCCYSCKAFFRRVVNTSKASKYKCRSGKNDCDITFANRRSCQACRYRKCVAAGMKPALVLSDDQCSKRFGQKKRPSRSGVDENLDDPESTEESRGGDTGASHQDTEVSKDDLALLIDGEKTYEEQNKIGRTLFVSLFDTGSVRNDGLEDRELEKYSSLNETVSMVKSFQIERQLNHSRQYLPFNSDKSGEKRKLLNENGKVNSGDIAQTLIDQTIMLLRHNKHFNNLQLSDQTELLECNLMTVTLLTIFEAYHGPSKSIVWKLTEPDFSWLGNHRMKVPHGRLTFNIQDILKEVDADLKEEATKLFNFFDYFFQIGLPRSSLYILLFVIVFNQNFAETKNKDDIDDCRKYYLFALFETLAVSEGVLGACSIAARLHSCLSDLTRIAQVLGQKFIDVEEN